ncbi:hypothetical protein AB1Y20_014351 [Prymnesium parvum]|uniref:Nuclear pore complex protein n=1 Tax=Prymnesium parvum TaxID=97485 RepID=A0AB34IFZ5_PRYPA
MSALFTPPTQVPPRRAPRRPSTPATTAALSHHFALELERLVQPHVPTQLDLLERYELLVEQAVEALQRRLDEQPRMRRADADAIAAERDLLRGEQSSWRLLRELFFDWEARQRPPPPYPSPPEDWGARLRELGPPAPAGLGPATPHHSAEVIQRRAREVKIHATEKSALSSTPANSGVCVRKLHDEMVQEQAIIRADPVLDIGRRMVAWLEKVAPARREPLPPLVDARPNETAKILKAALHLKLSKLRQRLHLPDGATAEEVLEEASRRAPRALGEQEGSLLEQLNAATVALGLSEPPPRDGSALALAETLPSSLDPDAAFSPSRRLAAADEAASASLLRRVWLLLRAGRLDDARQSCREAKQWWRAASLGGGVPFHEDPLSGQWEGNPHRGVWRRACLSLAARAARHGEVAGAREEAAVYGVLSGAAEAVGAVLPACEGWEDTLWAHARLRLEAHLHEQEEHLQQGGETPRLLPPQTLHDIFEMASGAFSAEPEQTHLHHQLQRLLVCLRASLLPSVSDEEAALAKLLEQLRDDPEVPPPKSIEHTFRAHKLRFSAHLFLFLFLLLRDQSTFSRALLQPFQPLLADYVELLGQLAVDLVSPPASAPAAIPLPEMAAAVALLASNLRIDDGARMDDAAIVDGVSFFMSRLPADLPLVGFHECLVRIGRTQLLPPRLLPQAVLLAVLRTQLEPLPSDGAALAAAVTARLQRVRWLCSHACGGSSPSDAEPEDVIFDRRWCCMLAHHALSQTVILLRAAFAAAEYTADALLPSVEEQATRDAANLSLLDEISRMAAHLRTHLQVQREGVWSSVGGGDVAQSAAALYDDPERRHAVAFSNSLGRVDLSLEPSGELWMRSHEGVFALRWKEEADGEAAISMAQLENELRMWWQYLSATHAYRIWKLHMDHPPPLAFDGREDAAAFQNSLHLLALEISSKYDAALRTRDIGSAPSIGDMAAFWGERVAEGCRHPLPQEAPRLAALRSVEGLKGVRSFLALEMVTNLHTVQLETGKKVSDYDMVERSFVLVELVADASYGIYELFTAEQVQELLMRFRSSALEMLLLQGQQSVAQ